MKGGGMEEVDERTGGMEERRNVDVIFIQYST